jgi:hypothetical protein
LLVLMARWFLRGEPPSGAGFACTDAGLRSVYFTIAVYAVESIGPQGISGIKSAIAIIITLVLKRGDMLRHVTYSILAGGIFLGTISTIQY